MNENVPDKEEFDPATVDRLRDYLDEEKVAKRHIQANSALSRTLWEELQKDNGSVSEMVTRLGGIEEVKRVYGEDWQTALEKYILEQSEKDLH